MSTTPIAQLPEILESQASKYLTHNQALRQLEALTFGPVQSRSLSAPPASPNEGDTYIVGAAATGAWTGKGDKIAIQVNGSWVFVTPWLALKVFCLDEMTDLIYAGNKWISIPVVAEIQDINHTATTNEITYFDYTLNPNIPFRQIRLDSLISCTNNVNAKNLRIKINSITLYNRNLQNRSNFYFELQSRLLSGASAFVVRDSIGPTFFNTSISFNDNIQMSLQLADTTDSITLRWLRLSLS